ncbi:protein S100-A2-like [Gymnogyps californianus]|uniref:protein S100-A2-like n=1 Tax=Gymnogyps californianus TaxID=33616 RepID=UPI0021C60044|nr:protein S100-A2-like [Gymnogyps californianus]
MATTLEQALASSIATFHERSGKEGDKYQRRKGELKELPSFMGEQLDERSFWVLLKDLEDKDNMMDFKEYVVLLGCLTMLCNNFCAKACGPASRHRAPAHGSNKTAVTFPAPLQSLFVCTGVTGMGVLGTICLGETKATQKAGGVGDSTVMRVGTDVGW